MTESIPEILREAIEAAAKEPIEKRDMPLMTPMIDMPAPIRQQVGWLRSLADKGGKGTIDNIDARSLGRIADIICNMWGSIEVLRAQPSDMTLPTLPKQWQYLSVVYFKHLGEWRCELQSFCHTIEPDIRVNGEGSTPRAAALAAIEKIGGSNE